MLEFSAKNKRPKKKITFLKERKKKKKDFQLCSERKCLRVYLIE